MFTPAPPVLTYQTYPSVTDGFYFGDDGANIPEFSSPVTSWIASKTDTSFWDNRNQRAPSPRAHPREALIFQYVLLYLSSIK